ncbi:TPA: hypothetical protein QCY03_003496 [Bacillus tropicus]|nr:hypothetical protein [Bacillus tropicus]
MMENNFIDLLNDARKLAKDKSWSSGFLTFWENVRNGTLPLEQFQSFVKEMTYYHENFEAFGSAILHHLNFDLMTIVSNYFIQMTRLSLNELKIEDDNLLHLPATEALCNMFLVQAETNPVSYFILQVIFLEFVLSKEDWSKVLDNLKIDVQYQKSFKNYLDVLHSRSITPESITEHITVKNSDYIDALKNTIIMLESAECLFEEIQSSYKRFSFKDLNPI